MRLLVSSAVILIAFGAIPSALGQTTKQSQRPQVETRQVNRATFTGSESWLLNLYVVQADCTQNQEPEVRMVSHPKNGEVRFEQRKVPISFTKESPRAHCNGKPVDAVSVVYKSKDGFVGVDRMTMDVNYKDGFIIRYVYSVDVR